MKKLCCLLVPCIFSVAILGQSPSKKVADALVLLQTYVTQDSIVELNMVTDVSRQTVVLLTDQTLPSPSMMDMTARTMVVSRPFVQKNSSALIAAELLGAFYDAQYQARAQTDTSLFTPEAMGAAYLTVRTLQKNFLEFTYKLDSGGTVPPEDQFGYAYISYNGALFLQRLGKK